MCFNLNLFNVCVAKTSTKSKKGGSKKSAFERSSADEPRKEEGAKSPGGEKSRDEPAPTTRLKQPPRTLALRPSTLDWDQDDDDTVGSLYLANTISLLVDRDRIVDTPRSHAAVIDDDADFDAGLLPSPSPPPPPPSRHDPSRKAISLLC